MLLAHAALLVCIVGAGHVWATPCTDAVKVCRTAAQTIYSVTQDRCKVLTDIIGCVGKSAACRGQLENTLGVTFEKAKDISEKECISLAPLLNANCGPLETCFAGLPQYSFLLNQDTYLQDTLKTGFWCKVMQHTLNCGSKNAATCKMQSSKTALDKSIANARKACSGADSLHKETLATVLALLAVAVLQKMST